ncbi:YpzI family protein [Evansella halocellulosilytica]|nr:YpzI family protein [Evansella halocellulosilytica]
MGKDRQETKLRKERKVESDRDQSLHFQGSTKLESSKNARKRQRP